MGLGALFFVTASHAVYLLRFHPYAKYPGPLLARLTPFHSLWHAYIGDLHLDVLLCHKRYGENPSFKTKKVDANIYRQFCSIRAK